MSDDVAHFSEIGDRYAEQLSRGLELTGESAEYFAARRIRRTAAIVAARGHAPLAVLDFGCGTGTSFAMLRAAFPGARLLGFEPAAGLRAIAETAARASGAELLGGNALTLEHEVDVVYCNGVFHHIAESDRGTAMQSIGAALRAPGLLFAWENSPFNPGTRWVMSKIPFDRDARLLTPARMRMLQADAGLGAFTTEYHFVFPRALRLLRPMEPAVRALPFGGQYVVVGEQAPRATTAGRGPRST